MHELIGFVGFDQLYPSQQALWPADDTIWVEVSPDTFGDGFDDDDYVEAVIGGVEEAFADYGFNVEVKIGRVFGMSARVLINGKWYPIEYIADHLPDHLKGTWLEAVEAIY